ncbi:hypothetical protein [Engelhardtia mirabilis]|uniref:Uncharacterized protein n=1 Tax=Engelhardtia mirabilis TaxID=2528011 RepID=A0A518BSV8_9BACT|nr:hypothetical protein Pla133_51710 [Planctomycetes bacterium Pla133]QDV04373.1 hypothetical protein Pla86_51680 [Planctomycetes bacterium Pla86]
MNTRLPSPSILITAALTALVGSCASGGRHVLETNVDGGLKVQVEGLAWDNRIELYAVVVEQAEGAAQPGITDVECRLFEDLDGNLRFDDSDRSLVVFSADGATDVIWHLGPLLADLTDGTPCLSTTATGENGSQLTQVLPVGDV